MADDQKAKKSKRPTAAKRLIQNQKRRTINRAFKSQVRTAVRGFEDSVKAGSKTLPQDALKGVYSLLDKAVKRGIFSVNKAARLKAKAAFAAAKAA